RAVPSSSLPDGLASRELVFDRLDVRRRLRGSDPELGEDLLLDLIGDRGVLDEERAGVLLALPELVAVVGVPGAGLAHDLVHDAVVDEAALAGDPDAVEDVELGLLEGRRHLVLDDLHARAVADRFRAVLEGLDAADVEPDRRVELERLAARGGLRAARSEEHTSEPSHVKISYAV